MDRDDPHVRKIMSVIGLILVIASLVVTFQTGSMVMAWALLLAGMVIAIWLRWKR